jgi:hypothetical protein
MRSSNGTAGSSPAERARQTQRSILLDLSRSSDGCSRGAPTAGGAPAVPGVAEPSNQSARNRSERATVSFHRRPCRLRRLFAGRCQRRLRGRVFGEFAPRASPLLYTRFILGSRCLRNFVGNTSVVCGNKLVAFRHSDFFSAGCSFLSWGCAGCSIVGVSCRCTCAVCWCFRLGTSYEDDSAYNAKQ